MDPNMNMGYDRASVTFDPDGRLMQVEYARESIKKGTISVGIVAKNGIALVVEKYPGNTLTVLESVEKVFKVDDHIGTASSGLIADARVLVDRARYEAQSNRMTFDEPIDVRVLTKKIANLQQSYTQISGLRPFGVSLLIVGIDEDGGKHLYETDPSGAMIEYRATAIGRRKDEIIQVLEQYYDESMNIDEAVMLVIDALRESDKLTFDPSTIEIGIISDEDRVFKKLMFDEVKDYAVKTNDKYSKVVEE